MPDPDDDLAIYHQQGFAQTLGIGQAPAVLVIDFVAGFTDPAHFGGGNIRPAIARTVGLLAAGAAAWLAGRPYAGGVRR